MNSFEKDIIAIEESIKNYLDKKYNIMDMVTNIEMLANATFDNENTKDFYNFLIDFIGEIEGEYFMKTDFPTTDFSINYNPDIMNLVKSYFNKLQHYKKHLLKGNGNDGG